MRRLLVVVAALALIQGSIVTSVPADQPAASRPAQLRPRGDWPMWGGTPDRNMVSIERNLPVKWDVSGKRNIKWSAELGTRTFGNVVVAGGRVFVGTNNGRPRNRDVDGDRGVLMCFAEADGRFLWQALHDKLAKPDHHDWPEIGICSTPCVVGDRVYYVSNSGELVCLDAEGSYDKENDGPIRDEKLTATTDADFIWRLDMRKQLGVVSCMAFASAPVVVDDLVFVVTGNGIDVEAGEVANPEAPSFIAVNRETGKLVWADSSPGDRIISGQWSSPAVGLVKGEPQAVFPGGDGWIYAFDPRSGKLIWKFNCKAHEKNSETAEEEAENVLVATPVIHANKVFIAVGQDPETGSGPGCLRAIDATGSGDVTASAELWRYAGEEFGRSISTVAAHDGLLYAAEIDGYLHCLDAATGKRLWRHDVGSGCWASPLLADGKVYIGTEDGDLFVMQHDRQPKLIAQNTMDAAVLGTAVAANGTLYIVARTHLYAIAAARPTATPDWPMFRGNAQLTGVATSTLPDKLHVRWRRELPDATESTAAIVGDRVYVGCDDGFLYVLDLAAGDIQWKYKAESPIKSSPSVHDNVVFFGDDDGVFHAIDVPTRAGKWTFPTEGEIISSANVVDGRVLFGSYDGFLYCLDVESGKLVWKYETEGRVHGTPGVIGDKVLIAGCDERLRVFRIADGTQSGAIDMRSFSGASAALSGSRVFVGTFNNTVLGMDFSANEVAWTYEHAERQFPFYASAAVTEDLVVIGGRDKLIHALDARTGKPRWTFPTRGRVDASPVIVGSRVFAASMDGNLYALDLATGNERWRFEAGAAILSSPAVGRGCLVIAAEDGVLYCFGDAKERDARREE